MALLVLCLACCNNFCSEPAPFASSVGAQISGDKHVIGERLEIAVDLSDKPQVASISITSASPDSPPGKLTFIDSLVGSSTSSVSITDRTTSVDSVSAKLDYIPQGVDIPLTVSAACLTAGRLRADVTVINSDGSTDGALSNVITCVEPPPGGGGGGGAGLPVGSNTITFGPADTIDREWASLCADGTTTSGACAVGNELLLLEHFFDAPGPQGNGDYYNLYLKVDNVAANSLGPASTNPGLASFTTEYFDLVFDTAYQTDVTAGTGTTSTHNIGFSTTSTDLTAPSVATATVTVSALP